MDDNSAPETEAAPSDLFLDRLLDATLELAPDMGWTRAALDRAAEKAGLSVGQALLSAPNGVPDVAVIASVPPRIVVPPE